jgi:hypothetical protein
MTEKHSLFEIFETFFDTRTMLGKEGYDRDKGTV